MYNEGLRMTCFLLTTWFEGKTSIFDYVIKNNKQIILIQTFIIAFLNIIFEIQVRTVEKNNYLNRMTLFPIKNVF